MATWNTDPKFWPGKNTLGKIRMELADEFWGKRAETVPKSDDYLVRARMSPSPHPVEAVPAGWLAAFVRTCIKNLLNRFCLKLFDCLVLWSSSAIFSIKEICAPLHVFWGVSNLPLLVMGVFCFF